MEILERIDKLIKEKGWSKYELADRCGLNRVTTWMFWEKGIDNIKLSNLKKLADGLGVSVDYLLNGETDSDSFYLAKEISLLNSRDRQAIEAMINIFRELD